MKKEALPQAQNPLILRANRLMEAFAKSDDERDFYLDRLEGFILYVDLDKPDENLEVLESELKNNGERYCSIPKMSFYETKKIMEGFVNEKVYDIDTKEKLLDIIQSKEARENFLEFIYDQHTEVEKWQQFYQERSRIRIIEWLRNNNYQFVFEEDLDVGAKVVEKLKEQLFLSKVGKDILNARKTLFSKAKTYYSNEALNPRPKRGRPPKQQAKLEIEPQFSADIYTTVPTQALPFLYLPMISGVSAVTFSAKYKTEEDLLKSIGLQQKENTHDVAGLNLKLATLREISSKWKDPDEIPTRNGVQASRAKPAPTVDLTRKTSEPPKKAPVAEKKIVKPKAAATKEKAPEKKVLRSIIPKTGDSKKPVKKIEAEPKNPAKKRLIPKAGEASGKKPMRKIIPNTPPKGKK